MRAQPTDTAASACASPDCQLSGRQAFRSLRLESHCHRPRPLVVSVRPLPSAGRARVWRAASVWVRVWLLAPALARRIPASPWVPVESRAQEASVLAVAVGVPAKAARVSADYFVRRSTPALR